MARLGQAWQGPSVLATGALALPRVPGPCHGWPSLATVLAMLATVLATLARALPRSFPRVAEPCHGPCHGRRSLATL